MFTRLSDVQKAVIFAVLAVALALVMVPLVTDSFITKVAYMWTPGIAVLVGLEGVVDRLPDWSAH